MVNFFRNRFFNCDKKVVSLLILYIDRLSEQMSAISAMDSFWKSGNSNEQ